MVPSVPSRRETREAYDPEGFTIRSDLPALHRPFGVWDVLSGTFRGGPWVGVAFGDADATAGVPYDPPDEPGHGGVGVFLDPKSQWEGREVVDVLTQGTPLSPNPQSTVPSPVTDHHRLFSHTPPCVVTR